MPCRLVYRCDGVGWVSGDGIRFDQVAAHSIPQPRSHTRADKQTNTKQQVKGIYKQKYAKQIVYIILHPPSFLCSSLPFRSSVLCWVKLRSPTIAPPLSFDEHTHSFHTLKQQKEDKSTKHRSFKYTHTILNNLTLI